MVQNRRAQIPNDWEFVPILSATFMKFWAEERLKLNLAAIQWSKWPCPNALLNEPPQSPACLNHREMSHHRTGLPSSSDWRRPIENCSK